MMALANEQDPTAYGIYLVCAGVVVVVIIPRLAAIPAIHHPDGFCLLLFRKRPKIPGLRHAHVSLVTDFVCTDD